MEVATIEDLRAKADSLRFQLAETRTAAVKLIDEIETIATDVGSGVIDRANEIPGLLKQQKTIEESAARQERELNSLRAELQRAEESRRKGALEIIFTRMEQRREKITELCRLAAEELGQLHSTDREAAMALIPPIVSSVDGIRFRELLAPIDPYDIWIDSRRDIVVESYYVIKVRPVIPL